MKALTLTAYNEFEYGNADDPAPLADNEVRIRVKACGICGSDLHILEGHHPRATYPRVPGHESVKGA